MRKILITNDDGIDADGIIRLAKAAAAFGEVWVVAPDSQRSAMSHSITLRTSFEAWPVEFPVENVHAYACTGTPADCIRIGCRNIVPGGPDVVFSGINYGYNCATDLQYSATAGAAFEASFQRVYGVAFSEDMSDMHEVTDAYLSRMIEEALEKPLGFGKILNINFPGCKLEDFKGIRRAVTVSSHSFFEDYYDETDLGEGRIRYRVNGHFEPKGEEGTDLRAILENCIAVGEVSNVGFH